MSCRIFFVRHGETAWNALMKLQGHADVSLSDRGREQVELLARRLAGEKIHCFYSSDLSRACETAEIIAKPHRLNIKTVPALREINFGVWEGLTIQEIKEVFADEIKMWWANPLSTRIPGGETLNDVAERSVGAVKKIIGDHSDENIVIVSHGGTIRSIIGSVLGMNLNEYWRLHLDNACLNLVDFPHWDRGILKLFNDCTHLSYPNHILTGT
ncbi:MAG: Phosphoserine phosphatase 1 [Pelotomaculum sp. PtaU1.Bin035]|nr:MAG: Phosphoserine phosphatase 1 [Pelotomaculum sp. PtaU1.Bin035]